MVAMKTVHHEELAKLSWKIEQLQNQNSSLQDQKGKVAMKMEEISSQFHEGWFFSIKKCYNKMRGACFGCMDTKALDYRSVNEHCNVNFKVTCSIFG